MSTRATFEFVDQDGRFTVYKHADGYPTGAAQAIAAAKMLAWTLPRFEANEFAAAFVAANKPMAIAKLVLAVNAGDETKIDQAIDQLRMYVPNGRYGDTGLGGDVRLVTSPDQIGDTMYHYRVEHLEGQEDLIVTAYRWNEQPPIAGILGPNPDAFRVLAPIYQGTLTAFADWAQAEESERTGGDVEITRQVAAGGRRR